MKPHKITGLLLLVAVVGTGAFYVGQRTSHDHGGAAAAGEKTVYTCGMHPQVRQDHPGNCPICGMKLTPVPKEGGATADLGTIAIDPVTRQNMGLRTGVVGKGPLRRTLRTVGVVDFDESARADVTTKFKGWAEKLYVDTTGQLVMRGDPLFEIYSPELYSAQTEYLLALGSTAKPDAGLDALKTSARLKLKFWDIADEQIVELERTRTPKKTLRVNAPIDGFVMEKMVVEGQMVEAGMKLYRIADLGLVWVQSEVYEQDLPFIRLGQEAAVSLTYLPDRKFRGRVTYIYPTVDERTRTVKVRMEFHNPGYLLKPGMFAAVEVVAELSPAALLVPDLAVATGKFQWVFYMLTPPVDSFNFEQNFQNFGFRRLQSFQSLGLGIVGMLLLYHPLRRFLTGRGIWLLPALAIGLGVGLLSGHRSFFITLAIMFALMAWAQRFFTLRHQLLVGCVLVPLVSFVYMFTDSLPDAGQRAVSFLPGIQVNAKAEMDANGTYMMRKEMATIGIKMIPHNLWIGRGFPIWNTAVNSAEHPDLRTINLFVEQGAFASGLIGLMVDTGLPGCLCMLLVILGGSIAAWRVFRETRRHGYEDPFALACCLSAASWLSTLFGFVFIQGNACAAMLTLGLPCGLVILCERMLRQRAQPGADEVPVAQGVGGS